MALTNDERSELEARTRAKLSDPDLLAHVCADVANGGSLVCLCETWRVRYADIVRWIYGDDGRKAEYENSLKARGEWCVQRILEELKRIGTVDIRRAYGSDGCLLPMAEIPEDVAAVIVGVETRELFDGSGNDREKIGELVKVKFADKIRSLELLGKNLAMFIDRSQMEVKGMTLEMLVAGSQARIEPAIPVTGPVSHGSAESASDKIAKIEEGLLD